MSLKTQIRRCDGLALVLLISASWFPAATSVCGDQPKLSFAVFATEIDGQISQPLTELLDPGDPAASVESFTSLEKAVASPAEVLVIQMPRSRAKIPDKLVQALRQRKVIGIGYGSAQLFGQLELEIKGGACAHFGGAVAEIQVQPNLLLEKNRKPQQIAPYAQPSSADNFGMHIPAGSDETLYVDVIARMKGDENYAPIVRQGNYVMIGLSASPVHWSQEYRRLFQDVARAMLEREKEAFKKPELPLLGPGKFIFTLDNGRSTKKPFSKTHYYKFTKPTVFTATLEHTGSNNMMLIFMGEKNRLHWTREDARDGKPLTIVVEITEADIKQNGDNHWTLKATNFDRDNPSTCVLSVQFDE